MNLVKGEVRKKEVEAVLLAIGVEAYTEGLLSPRLSPKLIEATLLWMTTTRPALMVSMLQGILSVLLG